MAEPRLTPHGWPRWTKLILAIAAACVFISLLIYKTPVLFLMAYSSWFSTAQLIETGECGKGEYRLELYKHRNGDGYFKLVDRNGQVYDESSFSQGTDIGDSRWAPDCFSVNVGTDGDRTDLKVRP
ncbi:hypothetical protein [Paracidovorax valerianellae]|nr:hypothetical protein [Paracidovorax valerianellae]